MSNSHSLNVLTYQTGWIANGLTWSARQGDPFRFAVGSFLQEYKNHIDIVQKNEAEELVCRATWEHCYPPTKIMFSPSKASHLPDLIITTADYLRLWEVVRGAPADQPPVQEKDLPENSEAPAEETKQDNLPEVDSKIIKKKQWSVDSHVVSKKVFDFGRPNDFCSPVTSCDWNVDDPKTVGCCSIDTTVTIWDIEAGKSTTQLIAHDKDVYDIAFAKGTHTFASCGADGSVRIFDLREMEHCTIVYETQRLAPLLRVAWNKLDSTYLSTFGVNGTEVIVIDIRYPSAPVATLKDGHTGAINSIGWAPHSATHMCSAGEDCTAVIWSLADLPNAQPTSFLNYAAQMPINSISWSPVPNEWIGITSGKTAQILKV